MVVDGVSGEECKLNNASTDPSSATDTNDDKGSDSDGDAAEEILEESPDKRWSKLKRLKQRDVPGIDAAFLAMDNETGNEVVWNEVLFSERKNFREQEEKLKAVFDNLTHLVHVNLVKFHKYWTDTKLERPRIIFITECMSSGSMSRFLQRTRSSGTLLNIKAWKKWTKQILSALNYLHQCDPPIVHANLSCNTVFIHENGLIKIGCVSPNAIHHHVKTFRENFKNMHYVAPEQEHLTEATTQTDIYAFGMCALEMTGALVAGNTCNGAEASSSAIFRPDAIRKALEAIEDPLQRDFIERCLNPDPDKRPTARELLFHPVLFEVHSLKLIAAHVIVNAKIFDQLGEDDLRVPNKNQIAFESKFRRCAYCELPGFQADLLKFLEDVKNGIYPLIAFAPLAHLPATKLHSSPSLSAISSADPRQAGSPEMMAMNSGAGLNGPTTSAQRTSAGGGGSGGSGGYDDEHRVAGGDGRDSMHSSPEPSSASVAKLSGTHQTHQQQHKNGYNGGVVSSGIISTTTVANNNSASNAAALAPPATFATTERDEGYHTAQSIVMGSASFTGQASALAAAGGPLQAHTAERPCGGEARLIQHMQATVDGSSLQVLLRLDDQMNRQLTTDISSEDNAENLVIELIQHGFISEVDSSKMCSMLEEVLSNARKNDQLRQNSPT